METSKAVLTQSANDAAQRITSALMFAMLMAVSFAANATAISTSDTWYPLYNMLDTWLSSGLGVSFALAAIIAGAIIGIAKTSVMPALIGFVLAAIIAWGPGVVLSIVTSGAVI